MSQLGRPQFAITEEVLETISEMASRGCPQYTIADTLGITEHTFCKYKKEDPRIGQAILEGKQRTIRYAENKLISIMHDDSTENKQMMFKALLFFLKTKGGWSTNRIVEVTTPDAPSSIKFLVDEDDE